MNRITYAVMLYMYIDTVEAGNCGSNGDDQQPSYSLFKLQYHGKQGFDWGLHFI